MRRRGLMLGLPAASLLASLALPAGAQARTDDGTTIRIGQSAPVTGALAQDGVAVRVAARAALAEVNAQGGIGGRRIELVTLDDENRAERTSVNVKLLASQHQVLALFGFVGAGAHRAGARGVFYTLSTVGGTALMDKLGQQAVGLSVTQVVPFPWTSSSAIGRTFQAFCARHKIEPSFASMEAYLSAHLLVDALRRARELTSARLAEALDRLPPRHFGGYVGAFHGESLRTQSLVDLTVFSRNGSFIR
jgi:ABC-type branched-subunit amino acid transport system substrate-binding protein